MTPPFDYEMAQALRRSHCERKEVDHECVGEMTVKRGEICLNCQLCGPAEWTPGWCAETDKFLRAVFKSAGVDWDALATDAKVDAIREFKARGA